MMESTQNGITVMSGNGKVIINGEEIPMPKGMKTGSQSMVDGKIIIGGYEYIESEKRFRKTGIGRIVENGITALSNLF